MSGSPEDYRCKECGELALYGVDHAKGCSQHNNGMPCSSLPPATPTTVERSKS